MASYSTGTAKKKKSGKRKYIFSISIVLVLTVVSLFLSLYNAGTGDALGDRLSSGANQIIGAIKGCNVGYTFLMFGMVLLGYLLDGLIILVFCRLYTRRYAFHQGFANSMIGAFYSAVTPGASGGQAMQVYTMKQQGIEVSNAASIMVMWFILYQTTLVGVDVLAVIFEWDIILDIKTLTLSGLHIGNWDGSLPLIPLIIFGFALNVVVILALLLMSYSHKIHNFIMHYGIGILAKIKIIKNPDRTRENLRVQVENFRIELKRLQSNIPVTVLIIILFFLLIMIRNSIPYFAGLALDAYGAESGFQFDKLIEACYRSAFHQMVTGTIPLPGGAGVSELFFNSVFDGYFLETAKVVGNNILIVRSSSANMATANILWRIATFHVIVIISGLFAAFYHSRPKEEFTYANHQTFVNIQYATYEERRLTANASFESKRFSAKELNSLVNPSFHALISDSNESEYTPYTDEFDYVERLPRKKLNRKKNQLKAKKEGN